MLRKTSSDFNFRELNWPLFGEQSRGGLQRKLGAEQGADMIIKSLGKKSINQSIHPSLGNPVRPNIMRQVGSGRFKNLFQVLFWNMGSLGMSPHLSPSLRCPRTEGSQTKRNQSQGHGPLSLSNKALLFQACP